MFGYGVEVYLENLFLDLRIHCRHIFDRYCFCFTFRVALFFRAFYCFAWSVISWEFPQSFAKNRLLPYSVRLATTTPKILTILYGSMLFYIVQHSYSAAARYFIYTLIVHGYFAPSIILFAIFSSNFKQDLAYFAC